MAPVASQKRIVCSWSGGKDSCYALIQAKANAYRPVVLLNVLNEKGKVSRSHGLSTDFLKTQANAMDLPIEFIRSTWQDYESNFINTLAGCRKQYQLDAAVYGDIDIETHRAWEQKVSDAAGLEAILPLWQGKRKALLTEMIEVGIKAVIVSCQNRLASDFLGKVVTKDMISVFEEIGVDPCGENGEYHTAVVDCPLFKKAIDYSLGELRTHEHYSFIDLYCEP